MLARCISNDFSPCRSHADLAEFLGLSATSPSNASYAPLVVGQEYLVVAFAFGPWIPWLFLADRWGLRYPLIYPSCMFSITDTRRSAMWERGWWRDHRGGQHEWLAPEVWAQSPDLPGKAFDGDAHALASFGDVVSRLSLEFSLPWVRECAIVLGNDGWVINVDYSESWKANPAHAMTVRPSTGALLHNPLHRCL